MEAIKACGMKGDIYHATYHCMNTGSKEESMDNLESSPNTKQMNYTLIMSFTKFDIIIKLLTRGEFNRVKLHKEVKFFLPPKPRVILKEKNQYRFPENLIKIARRWLDAKLIKNDKGLEL